MAEDSNQKEGLSAAESDNCDTIKKRPHFRSLSIMAFIVIVGVVSIVLWRVNKAPRGVAITKIVGTEHKPGMIPKTLKPLGDLILANFKEYRGNTVKWSGVYYSCLFLSAVFSAFAGFVLKVGSFPNASVLKEDLAALLAMLAALLITLSTVGDFQSKWQANRIAASEVEGAAYDLARTPFGQSEIDQMISRLKEISLTRNQMIVGESKHSSYTLTDEIEK